MIRIGFISLFLAAVGTVGLCVLLWYEGGQSKVRALSSVAAVGIVLLVHVSGRLLSRERRWAYLYAVLVAIFLALSIVNAPFATDRRSTWNEAVRAMQLMRDVVETNRKYAEAHQGSFAHNLADLHEQSEVGRSYVITYEVIEDQDHVVRHYVLRGIPRETYSISIYTDETGVIRINGNGPADRNSREIS